MSLLNVLKEMNSKIEKEISDLNYGGCCCYAAHVAKRLQHVVPTRILVYNDDQKNIDYIRRKLRNNHSIREWNDNGMGFAHVVVEFDYDGKTYIMDSEGIHLSDSFNIGLARSKGALTIDEAIALASRPNGWNSWFDRTQLPTLRKIINGVFKKINTPQLTIA